MFKLKIILTVSENKKKSIKNSIFALGGFEIPQSKNDDNLICKTDLNDGDVERAVNICQNLSHLDGIISFVCFFEPLETKNSKFLPFVSPLISAIGVFGIVLMALVQFNEISHMEKFLTALGTAGVNFVIQLKDIPHKIWNNILSVTEK